MWYSIGLDYGTNSCRCVIVNVATGEEVGTAIYEYQTGEHGIILYGFSTNETLKGFMLVTGFGSRFGLTPN
jgi:ribulose kinase